MTKNILSKLRKKNLKENIQIPRKSEYYGVLCGAETLRHVTHFCRREISVVA